MLFEREMPEDTLDEKDRLYDSNLAGGKSEKSSK